MRKILIGLALVLVALPAWAQGRQDNWRRCADKNPDLSIDGCTAVIQSTGQETDEGFAVAYFKRGDAYYNKGLYDQSIADETQAIALKPDLTDAYGHRGLAYEKKGLPDMAIPDYRTALKLAAGHPTRDVFVADIAKKGLQRLGATP
jgi:tetratricopeptide (TPR) repeat protein